MLKYVAGLSNLRYAKDEAGYLKRVKTPGENGVESYMTVKWDQLVPFPTSKLLSLAVHDGIFWMLGR